MNDMKCPFCGEKIEHIEDGWCNCKNRCTGSGSIELWLQFIRTRRALEMAKNAMKSADTHNSINCIVRGEDPSKDDVGITINHALEQITAILENKNGNC